MSTTSEVVFDDRRSPVRLRQAFLALLVTLVAEVVLVGGALLLVKAGGLASLGPDWTVALLAAATVLAAAASYHVLVRRGGLTLAQLGFFRPTRRQLHLLWQAPLAVLASAATGALVLRLATGSSVRAGRETELADFGAASSGLFLAVLVVGVATPLWEEALFRGAFYLGFLRRAGPVAAVVGSAAVFAASHVVPVLWAFVFPLGLCLGWLRWFHRNLWASAAVHGLNNLLAISAVFLVGS